MLFIDVDISRVYEIVAYNDSFISPFSGPYSYYMYISSQDGEEHADQNMIELYLNKLNYAVKNSDTLINQAFHVFQSKIDLPTDIWQKLMFESFVVDPDHEVIFCCISNPSFMAGHYIECRWDFNWNLIFIHYC